MGPTRPIEPTRTAWWFASTPTQRGDVHRFDGEPIPGRAGLHAATGPVAALAYAKSAQLCHVELGGTIVEVDGQLAATWRRVRSVLDASDALRPLVAGSIERLLGGALETRDAHLDAAGAARDAARAAADRVRDARWVLEEGAGARSPMARAQAEGALAGAELAAAEARANAEAHEAAAALLEGTSIHHLARAVDHLVDARAAFEKGDAPSARIPRWRGRTRSRRRSKARSASRAACTVRAAAPSTSCPAGHRSRPRGAGSASIAGSSAWTRP